jgi:hypothetical protein
MIRAWLIHLFGGITYAEAHEWLMDDTEELKREIEICETTIEELSALIPAPKKPKGKKA